MFHFLITECVMTGVMVVRRSYVPLVLILTASTAHSCFTLRSFSVVPRAFQLVEFETVNGDMTSRLVCVFMCHNIT
jgi:uncharacterized membrane protein YccF (DUF307 family)